MPMPSDQTIDAATARRLTETQEWRWSAPPARERAVEGVFAAATLAAALLLAVLVEPARPFSLPIAAVFVVVYAAVARVEFTLGDGIVVPTQLVFVPMLLLVPTPFVPLLVVIALSLRRSSTSRTVPACRTASRTRSATPPTHWCRRSS